MVVNNIILIGLDLKVRNKTAQELADLMNYQLIHLDDVVGRIARMPAQMIEDAYGLRFLHECQTEAIESLRDSKNCIIDCTGDVVIREKNMRLLQGIGVIVWADQVPTALRKKPTIDESDELSVLRSEYEKYRLSFERYSNIRVMGNSRQSIATKIKELLENGIEINRD